ncbi:MAG: DUF4258 domain-containing protein [Euryarchaeota archaeon]|nr:DUF4258 domain-containing protein [Euryarchaeota archaeon]
MPFEILKSGDVSRGKLFKIKANETVIRVIFTWHSLDGAGDYDISTNELLNFLIHPEEVIRGHANRFIAHRRLNHHLARVVYEYENGTIIVITFYISHVNRYFRGGIYEDKILP